MCVCACGGDNVSILPQRIPTAQVRRALMAKQPVVALESTIISHGMPFPQNLEMARGVEEVVQASVVLVLPMLSKRRV